jgi:hypothetical protein
MIDIAKEKVLPLEERFRLYVRRLQLWRLCGNAACHRARACRGEPKSCGRRFADWSEIVKEAAQREFNARDPAFQAERADLMTKLDALSRTMTRQA